MKKTWYELYYGYGKAEKLWTKCKSLMEVETEKDFLRKTREPFGPSERPLKFLVLKIDAEVTKVTVIKT